MIKFTRLFKLLALAIAMLPAVAFAAEGEASSAASSLIPIGASIAIGLAALGGTLGQSKAVSAALESIGRNPSASGGLFTPMLLGLVFMESLVIFGFVIAFLMIGKI